MRIPGTTDVPTALVNARSAAHALEDGGVREVVLCPGSRSAPLAYAVAESEARGALRVHVRIDERDAGFTALGLSLASGRPVAVVTTSGTAVGELMPAVMEANHAGVQLVILTADRPEELRGTGANQTTHQVGLFGTHVRIGVDVPAGSDPAPELRRALLAAEGIAVSDGRGELNGLGGIEGVSVHVAAPGPVHINIGFRDPLVPGVFDRLVTSSPPSAEPAPASAPDTKTRPIPVVATTGTDGGTVGGTDDGDIADLTERRTVVVAGHDAGPVAEDFARRHGFPLLAEPSSNARFGPNAIGPYRLLVPAFEAAIERVVVFGRPTLSRPIARLLGSADVHAALYVPEPVAWFDAGRRNERIIDEPEDLARFAGRGAAGWLRAWREAGAAAASAIDAVLESEPTTGLLLAREVWATAPGTLVLGSSNAIRDADLAGAPTDEAAGRVFANRGLAGIDGTVATATGIALGAVGGAPSTLLVGDVTFLHDVGGLLLGRGEAEPDLDIVVLNDGGGAIFSTLEHGAVAESGHYGDAVERLFGTPHAVRLEGLAAAYGIDYVRVAEASGLRVVLAARQGRRRIVDVTVNRSDVRGLHRRIAAIVARAVAATAERALAEAKAPTP